MSYYIHLLGLISHILLFLSLISFLIKRIEIGKEKRLFVYFIAYYIIAEVLSRVTSFFLINNLGMTHVYFPTEFFFFFFILYQWENRFKKYWLISGLLIGVFVLADNFIATPFSKFAIYSASLQYLFMFLFSARQIIELTTKSFIPFYRDDRFYIAAGIFIYSSITALMFLFYNLFAIRFQFNIGYLSMVFMNFFFTYSMVLHYRQRIMLAEALN